MDRAGYSALAGCLSTADLEGLRQFVETAVAATGGEYVALAGDEAVAGTLLEKLSASSNFDEVLHQVLQAARLMVSRRLNRSDFQVLRCLKGKSGLKHALRFWFTTPISSPCYCTVITPSKGNAGHLVMAPNWRPVRSSYLFNLFDKIILDNPVTQFLLRHRSGRAA